GTYTLALNPFTEENLSYTLLATKPTASAVLSFEGEISATTSESNPAFFTFEIDNARPVTISTTGDPLPFLTVQGPNLSSIPTNYPLPDATSFTYPVMLPYSGTYLIAAYGDGDFSISLDSLQPIPV